MFALLVVFSAVVLSTLSSNITGNQILDLPAPPSPPGFGSQVVVNEEIASVSPVSAISSQGDARINSLESDVAALKVAVANLNSEVEARPFVDAPTFFGEMSSLAKRNTFLSVTLFIVLLVIIVLFVFVHHSHSVREHSLHRNMLRQYLLDYKKAGYTIDVLRNHLVNSGWDSKIVDDAVNQLTESL